MSYPFFPSESTCSLLPIVVTADTAFARLPVHHVDGSLNPTVAAASFALPTLGTKEFLRRQTLGSQARRAGRLNGSSAFRLSLLLALSAGPAYGAGDMVSNFLTSVVSLITSTWAIAIVVIATFYVGYLFFFSDRRTHEHLSGWLFGCIFVLGCQVLAQQFIH